MADTKANKNNGIAKIVALGSAGLMIFAAFFLLFTGQHSKPFLSFQGISSATSLSINFEQGGKIVTLPQDGDNNSVFQPPATMEQAAGYKLSAVARTGDAYRDITLINDKEHMFFVANGFGPGAPFRFSRDGQTLLEGLHLDWSGHIEIKSLLEGTPENLCFEIDSDFTLCHAVVERRKA